jgi:hypothetical protein
MGGRAGSLALSGVAPGPALWHATAGGGAGAADHRGTLAVNAAIAAPRTNALRGRRPTHLRGGKAGRCRQMS